MTLIRKTLLFSTFLFFGCQSVQLPKLRDIGQGKEKKIRKRPISNQNRSSNHLASNKRKTTVLKPVRASRGQVIRKDITREAQKYQGIPYTYGGKQPRTGFDCSGFSTFIYSKNGFNLSGSSSTLAQKGRLKNFNEIEEGDLAFFGNNGKVTHVAIVLLKSETEFKVIHSTSSKGVVISDILQSTYWMNRYLFTKDLISDFSHGLTGLD